MWVQFCFLILRLSNMLHSPLSLHICRNVWKRYISPGYIATISDTWSWFLWQNTAVTVSLQKAVVQLVSADAWKSKWQHSLGRESVDLFFSLLFPSPCFQFLSHLSSPFNPPSFLSISKSFHFLFPSWPMWWLISGQCWQSVATMLSLTVVLLWWFLFFFFQCAVFLPFVFTPSRYFWKLEIPSHGVRYYPNG